MQAAQYIGASWIAKPCKSHREATRICRAWQDRRHVADVVETGLPVVPQRAPTNASS